MKYECKAVLMTLFTR